MPSIAAHADPAPSARGRITVGDVEAMVAAIDAKVSAQLNAILHHEDFQRLESAWRGLKFLVSRTETDELLKVRCLSISRAELARTLRRYKGTGWDQSPIFRRIYAEEFGQFGGHPYGCLLGDYSFDHTAPDLELLGEMAKIGAAAHVPFIAGASPSVLQMSSWLELPRLHGMAQLLATPEYAAWRSLRETEDARYLGLALPRFLARLPYGARTNPVQGLDFEEDTGGADQSKYLWCNAAFAMAVNVMRSFSEYGWACSIRGVDSGGIVKGLIEHRHTTSDGQADTRCTTEVAIGDRREAELAKAGFMPLVHIRGSGQAVFIGAQSLQKPAQLTDPDASANASLAARLPYIFATCRFAHYLKCIVRDKIATFTDRAAMERYLHDWIMGYVDGDPANSSDAVKAQKPLAAAEVVVEEAPDKPGTYLSKFALRPHYQLEGLTVSLRLLSRLPARAR